MTTESLFVGGCRTQSASGKTFAVTEPGTGAVLAEVAEAGPEDAARAVKAAHDAFEEGPWPRMSPTRRGRVLARAAQLLRERHNELAVLEARNAGKPIRAAYNEIALAADVFEYWAGAADKIMGETIPVQDAGLDLTLREPVGVCALITPWNYPFVITSWKVAPALACGNTVVAKPASYTPLTALKLAEILGEAGLPPDVVSVLPGPGTEIGHALITDPRVAKVSFTGSCDVGSRIMAACAANITRVSLELGGKSANVIFADADMEKAVAGAIDSAFDNCGQNCCARSRILVQRSAYGDFVAAVVRGTEDLVVGQPLQEGSQIGPLISADQRRVALDYLAVGQREGARLVTGGDIPPVDGGKEGFYLRPAVLADARNDMVVSQEEIFGPVVCVIPFDTEEEAIRLANDVPYGLSGSVWTSDLGKAVRVVKGMRTGAISVNSEHSVHTQAPFGGYKRSGIGREMGMHAVSLYTEVKNVFISQE